MPRPTDFMPILSLLIVLGLCFCGLWSMWLALDQERKHHNDITVERAMEILRSSLDTDLRNAAMVKLQDSMGEAIRLLQARSDAGDLQAQAVLGRWRALMAR